VGQCNILIAIIGGGLIVAYAWDDVIQSLIALTDSTLLIKWIYAFGSLVIAVIMSFITKALVQRGLAKLEPQQQ
jgi:hypothetical protein